MRREKRRAENEERYRMDRERLLEKRQRKFHSSPGSDHPSGDGTLAAVHVTTAASNISSPGRFSHESTAADPAAAPVMPVVVAGFSLASEREAT